MVIDFILYVLDNNFFWPFNCVPRCLRFIRILPFTGFINQLVKYTDAF